MVNTRDTLKPSNTFYKLLANQTIPLSKILIIQPGTTLQFSNGNNTVSQLDIQGTLLAEGSNANNIYFTGLGLSLSQQCGPVIIEALSYGSVLQYITINGLGYYYNTDYTPAIIVRSNTCSILNCFIQNSAGTALQIDKCSPNISNNIFSNPNKLDVIADFDKIKYLSNNNALKVGLTAGALMGSNDTLTSNNTFYRILVNQTIPQGKTLVINPGVTVQFPNGNNTNSQLIVAGTLKALGTSANPISFTGFNVGLSQQTDPITFQSTSVDSKLQFVNFNNLGYYYYNITSTSILNIASSSLTITNCSFTNGRGIAVNISNSSSPFFKRNCFITNAAAILSSSGKAIVDSCNFIGNTAYGLNNTSKTDTINAANCFWGDLSGPRAATNVGGSGDSVSVNVIYQPFNISQLDCSETVLASILFSFKSTYISSGQIDCSWQTTNETNSSYFTVQRSTDGINFSTIGKVYASGNSSLTRSYNFTDRSPNSGLNYYRLQMVDKDGKFSYSKIITINITITSSFIIYPNPVKDNLFIQVHRNKAEEASLFIFDMQGKLLQNKSYVFQPGITTVSMATASLSKGSYFAVIKGRTTQKKMFVKE